MRLTTFQLHGAKDLVGISWRRFRLAGAWLLSIGGCLLVLLHGRQLPAWQFMWLILATIFAGCKLLTLANLERGWSPRLWGYLLLWPGMQPRHFLPEATPPADRHRLWRTGATNLLTGLGLLILAVLGLGPSWLRAWLTMVAFSFVVHFGIFDLMAAGWRRAGVPVEKLFVCPVAARSLADFWSNRWNRAFSAFARDLLFLPAARRIGTVAVTLVVFGFSGLAHELVISVPAGGGYGGPMLYFLFQGLLVLLENSWFFRTGLRHHRFCAWLWTASAVLIPLPLLFPAAFLQNVVLPFLTALGG
jgi:alginate O-acetyltransferase complex protein AlgI